MTRVLAFIAVGIALLALIVALNVTHTPPAEPTPATTFEFTASPGVDELYAECSLAGGEYDFLTGVCH